MSGDASPRAPSGDFGLFARPPMPLWSGAARKNRQILQRRDLSLGGVPLPELRRQARIDFLECARAFGCGPTDNGSDASAPETLWFMTGHQPELYHPGVWAKNFAVAAAAQASGGIGVNLVADTDLVKSTAIRVVSGSYEAPKVLQIPFDTASDGRPYEAWNIRDEQIFRRFAESVREVDARLPDDPLFERFWPAALAVDSASGSRRFSLARHAEELEWGFGLVEAPMGLWAQTPAVARFFCAILSDLPRFHRIHAERLSEYRREHKIHSRNHPVADLLRKGDWYEAPLWVWRDSSPLRKKLWARSPIGSAGVELRIEGESRSLGILSMGPEHIDRIAIDGLLHLAVEGVRVRPRALVTTALCRILLADLFVHGIGGAIYDVLGDSVFGPFFGIPLPEYAVMSATLRLSDFPQSHLAAERDEQFRLKRRLAWKAESANPELPGLSDLLEEKRRWLALPTDDRIDRRRRAVELRRVNRAIARRLSREISEVDARIEALSRRTAAEAIVSSREFSIVIHSESRLRRLAEKIRNDFDAENDPKGTSR